MPTFVEVVRRALLRTAPEWEIECSSRPDDAVTLALDGAYDVVVLDWELRHATITGLTICRELRSKACRSAIVLLTVRDSPDDGVASARAGADDHIVKGLGLREIHARIKVAGVRGPRGGRLFKCGMLEIDLDRQQLILSGEPVELSKHQWLIVARMVRWPCIPVGADELCQAAGVEPGEDYKNLRNEVHRLRRRLDERHSGAGGILRRVRGVGYMLDQVVERLFGSEEIP